MMEHKCNRAVWWIKRDLCLADNPALKAALESAALVVQDWMTKAPHPVPTEVPMPPDARRLAADSSFPVRSVLTTVGPTALDADGDPPTPELIPETTVQTVSESADTAARSAR